MFQESSHSLYIGTTATQNHPFENPDTALLTLRLHNMVSGFTRVKYTQSVNKDSHGHRHRTHGLARVFRLLGPPDRNPFQERQRAGSGIILERATLRVFIEGFRGIPICADQNRPLGADTVQDKPGLLLVRWNRGRFVSSQIPVTRHAPKGLLPNIQLSWS